MLNKLVLLVLLLGTIPGRAAETELKLDIRDHLFFPTTLEIPAGQKVRVRINNLDPTPEEFESYSLNREKVIPANSSTVIFLGPLKAGEYLFFGEFYSKTAQGRVIAR